MFKDCKTNAFNIEKTRVNNAKRIETLLIPITFTYIFSIIEGYTEEQKETEKKKETKRSWIIFNRFEKVKKIYKEIIY